MTSKPEQNTKGPGQRPVRVRRMLHVCLDNEEDLACWVEQEAAREGRSVSEFIRRLLIIERATRGAGKAGDHGKASTR